MLKKNDTVLVTNKNKRNDGPLVGHSQIAYHMTCR